ncbi:MAG: type II secretion system F family protein [Chromatiales bacterium]|nr:type II secretion system F family protein [Chromatiales bacterium]
MSAYSYAAVDPRGRTIRGTIDGSSARHARDQLREDGLTVLHIEGMSEGTVATTQVTPQLNARLSDPELTLFLRLLGSLLEAGLELEAALRASQRQATAKAGKFYAVLVSKVLEGLNLSEALASMGAVQRLGVAAIAAGERAGKLAGVLSALADHGERRADMRNRITMALLYPAILTVVAVGVALALVTYVVPEVARVFEGYERELPFLTRALLGLSSFLNTHGLMLALVGGVISLACWFASRRPAVRHAFNRILMATPGVRILRLAMERERFLDTLAMLLGGGVPLVEAMRGATDVLVSEQLRRGATLAVQDVERGQTLALAMQPSGLLSPITTQLVTAGEEGARLEEMLMRAARIEGDRLQRRLAASLILLEPALILVMGVMVLLIVLAILLPIFELNTLIT